jgi:eukaryotic-like serine/threonine-protein kinase
VDGRSADRAVAPTVPAVAAPPDPGDTSPGASSDASSDVAPEAPAVPGYRLERLLGRGGSGEVWRARPRDGGPPVAVKVLVAGDGERQAREAALLGALDHPHLVRLHEVVHQPRRGGPARVALVLDLLEGGSLAALLARRGRLRPGEVVTALAPVAAALACAHEQGVVHGDLSPGNVVFTAEGRPVLTDLGVARVLGEDAAGEVTPPYVDPAVARGGAPGPASDVFGVAAAAFHALTGVPPWNAATPADTLAVAATGELPDLAELAPGTPPALLEVVARGLAADPHARGSAAAFALDLRHACRPEPVRLPTGGIPDVDLARTGRGPRTELTHRVPARHRREAPPEVRTRPERSWGPPGLLARRAAAAIGVAALVLGAVALGLALTRSGPGGGAVPAATDAAVATAPPASSVPPTDAADPAPTPTTDPPTVPPPAAPVDWTAVLTELYARRASAFTTGDPALLEEVYAAGSPLLAADRAYLEALGAAGELLRGFAPSVSGVTVTAGPADDGTVQLRVVDSRPDCAVVSASAPDGPPLRTEPGRGEVAVAMVLVPGPDGWRIGTAGRLA